jgi:hypothetical protein
MECECCGQYEDFGVMAFCKSCGADCCPDCLEGDYCEECLIEDEIPPDAWETSANPEL